MKNVVLSGDEFNNGLLLFQKGPTKKEILPNDKVNGLINQGLADIDEHEVIALSEKGMQYYREYEEDVAQNEKEKEADAAIIEAKKQAADKIKDQPAEATSLGSDSAPEESESTDETEPGEEQSEMVDENNPPEAEEDPANEETEHAKKDMEMAKEAAILSVPHIAQEGVSELLKTTMPSLVNGFQALVNTIKPKETVMALTVKEAVLLNRVEKITYINLADLMLPVPEGMQTKYLTYIAILEDAIEYAQGIAANLEEFTKWVAKIITNASMRNDTARHDNRWRKMQDEREVRYKAIGSCFGTTNNDKLKYSKLLDRNADWHEVINRAHGLTKAINKIDRTELLKQSKHVQSLLEKVLETSKRNGFDATSPEVLASLSEGSFQIASELEFYSVVFYRTSTFLNRLEAAIATLDKSTSLKRNKII